jgi:kinesin family member 2/24
MIRDYRSMVNYKPMTSTNMKECQSNQKDLRICVAVRKRALNKREIAKKDNDVFTIPNRDDCFVHVPKSKVDLTKYLDNQSFKCVAHINVIVSKRFSSRFDYTFDEWASNDLVYRFTAAPLIKTIFAYVQSGSRKCRCSSLH